MREKEPLFEEWLSQVGSEGEVSKICKSRFSKKCYMGTILPRNPLGHKVCFTFFILL